MKEVFIVKVIGESNGDFIRAYLNKNSKARNEPYVFSEWMQARQAIKDSDMQPTIVFEIVSAYQKTGE